MMELVEIASQLKACPFCGGIVTLKLFDSGNGAYIVCPQNTPCRGGKLLVAFKLINAEQAIETWNNRNPIPSIDQ